MTETNRSRRGRKTTRRTGKETYGGDIATLDRMQEVWALRVRGYSFRAIGQQIGVSHHTAWRDCQEPPDNLALMDDQSIARAQLLQGHRLLMDALMAEIEQQRQNGCITKEVLPDGSTKTKITRPDGRLIGEAGRCLDRAARLLGLLDGPLEGEPGGNGTTNTSIVLVAPGAAAEFGARAEALAAARAAEPTAIDVQATPEPASTPPEAAEPHQASQAAPEPVQDEVDADAALARVAAERAARVNGSARRSRRAQGGTQRPAVRFLPQPQRN
jgi:hypothetical protein